MKEWNRTLRGVATLTLAVTVFAACSDDDDGPTEPGGDVNPVQTADVLNDLSSDFFTDNEAVQTVNGLTPFIAGVVGQPSIASLDVHDWKQVLSGSHERLVERLRKSGPALETIPENLQGTVWVFDTENNQYVLDTGNDEGPDDGVRMILYAIDPTTGLPLQPLDEVGYLDIRDTSTLPTITIIMTAVVNDNTAFEITSSATEVSETEFTLDSEGFFASPDRTEQLDFSIDVDFSQPTETSIDVSASVTLTTSELDIQVDLDVSGDEQTGEFTATLSASITSGGDTIAMSFTSDAQGNVDGNVEFNGEVVAIVTGSVNPDTGEFEVSITNAEGGDLTEAELEALADIFEAFGGVFEAAFGIFFLAILALGFGF